MSDLISLKTLYPELSPDQRSEAEFNIRRYLAVVIRMAERLEAEGISVADVDLTASGTRANVPDERSNPTISKN
jgi:hypothetical protein